MSTFSHSSVSADSSSTSHIADVLIRHVRIDTQTNYTEFVARLDAQMGRHDPAAYQALIADPASKTRAEEVISAQAGASGFMTFAKLDFGVLVSLRGQEHRATQYMIGNPLAGKARVEYDQPSSLFGQFENHQVDVVAKNLDEKLKHLIETASQAKS